MGRLSIANDILNDTAIEVGLTPVNDPVSSDDEAYVQLLGLLNSAGRELVELNEWQALQKNFSITTSSGDSGRYDLPADFSRIINQTGWDQGNRVAVVGPLSPQDWSYLEGRDLVSQSIYASFRLLNGKLELYPQPPPDDLTIKFEYISRNWVYESGQVSPNVDRVDIGSDLIAFEALLVIKFLKCKFLEAKGFDSSAARLEFDTVFHNLTGHDTGAVVLNASRNGRQFPYLDAFFNVGDTGYGS